MTSLFLRHTLPAICCILFSMVSVNAEQASLFKAGDATYGWTSNNGAEFPGAVVSLEKDDQVKQGQTPSLRLTGDFTKGGGYVQILRSVPAVEPEMLSFWLRYPGSDQLTFRLIDKNRTCFQVVMKIESTDQWQRIEFPIEKFFKNMGTPNAVPGIVKVERWGKMAKSGWTPPLKSMAILLSKAQLGEAKSASMWLDDIQLSGTSPKDRVEVTQQIRLDDVLNAGYVDWNFSRGQEFAGAKGDATFQKDTQGLGHRAIKVAGDFTDGGAYVSVTKDLSKLDVSDISAVRLKIKSDNTSNLTIRVNDASGQAHQRKGVKITPDGQWQDLVIDPDKIAGGEHWGGAKDGKIHPPIKSVTIGLTKKSDAAAKQPVIFIGDIRADVSVRGTAMSPTYTEGFEGEALDGWNGEGQASLVTAEPFEGTSAIRLTRPLDRVNDPVERVGQPFTAAPGKWEFNGASRGEMHTPDNSFHGLVEIQWLGNGGRMLEKHAVELTPNQPTWSAFRQVIEAPRGTTAGRVHLTMKKTYGWFEVDGLSASHVTAPAAVERSVERMHLRSDVTGHMFMPDQTPILHVEVLARKPLKDSELDVNYQVRDFWGAAHSQPQKITLSPAGYKQSSFSYKGDIELDPASMNVGQYYEIHATLQPESGEPLTEYRGIARMEEALTKQYDPELIPFSIRNWDSRIQEYFYLADRIGIRQIGMWGRWSPEAPEKAQAHGMADVIKLGQKGIVGLPGSQVERGNTKYTHEVLRDGLTALLEKHGIENISSLSLGNEPHGGLDAVKRNVKAYKSLYETSKSLHPDLFVIGTSNGPDRRYFEAGFQNYLDAYDFHTYESYQRIERSMREYEKLMEEFDAVKPIYSTEIGVNSQGMSRYAVASEMFKKFSVFFANGGANLSWFTIMYPDPQGKSRGTFGQAHCVFDARFNEYNPRLDAISLYHITNGIAIKKFVNERADADGTRSYLFKDDQNQCLQIVWNESDRRDTHIPVPGASQARIIRIDGSESILTPTDGGVTVTVSSEPLMLLYESKSTQLEGENKPGVIKLTSNFKPIVKGGQVTLKFAGSSLKAERLRVTAPLNWETSAQQDGDGVSLQVNAPTQTDARASRLIVQALGDDGQILGESVITLPVTDGTEATIVAGPRGKDEPESVVLEITNHEPREMDINWSMQLTEQFDMANGTYDLKAPADPTAFFAAAKTGQVHLKANQSTKIVVPLSGVQDSTVYRIRGVVTGASGRKITTERFIGGFASAPRSESTVTLDGKLDEPVWQRATIHRIDQASQALILKSASPEEKWTGPEDLTGTLRFAWDDENFYVAVEVQDDVFSGPQSDARVWSQDGLQFLIDPSRNTSEKPGKYDYSMGVGVKGPQVWCSSTIAQYNPAGEVKDVTLVSKRAGESNGNIVYEVAFPWKRLAPFKPTPGANLGLAMIINEDDGQGRFGFSGWFSGVHTKQLDMVGDLVLGE